MSVRHVFEQLGLISPRDPEMEAAREIALAENRQARHEIHASRERRAILQMRHEQILRRMEKRKS